MNEWITNEDTELRKTPTNKRINKQTNKPTKRLTGHHRVALVRGQVSTNGCAGCGEAGLRLLQAAVDERQRVQSLERRGHTHTRWVGRLAI